MELTELDRQLVDDPGADAVWLAFGEALEAKGHPLGARILRPDPAHDSRWMGALVSQWKNHDLVVTWRHGCLRSARLRAADAATLTGLLDLPVSRYLESLVLDVRTPRGHWQQEHALALELLALLGRTAPPAARSIRCLTTSPWGVFEGLAPLEAALQARCPHVSAPALWSSRGAKVVLRAAGSPPVFALTKDGGTEIVEGAALELPLELACHVPDPVLGLSGKPVRWHEHGLSEGTDDPRLETSINGRRLPAFETASGARSRLPPHGTVRPGDVVTLATGFCAELVDDEVPVRTTRFVKPVREGQDPIECTEVYVEAMKQLAPEIEALVRAEDRGQRGLAHLGWNLRRRLLLERYGIAWRSPPQMNPGHMYD